MARDPPRWYRAQWNCRLANPDRMDRNATCPLVQEAVRRYRRVRTLAATERSCSELEEATKGIFPGVYGAMGSEQVRTRDFHSGRIPTKPNGPTSMSRTCHSSILDRR